VGDADAAQDLAQDAFVDAYRSLRTLKDPDRFRAWLHGILHHKCSKHLARSARGPVLLESVDPAPPVALHDPLTEITLSALNRLPDDCRSLLAARYLQELSYEEMASALGATVNSVRVRCCRAKARLRALVEKMEVGEAAWKGGLT
jgi:RNA polymerase sigma-70 factor (ECF subfamily)